MLLARARRFANRARFYATSKEVQKSEADNQKSEAAGANNQRLSEAGAGAKNQRVSKAAGADNQRVSEAAGSENQRVSEADGANNQRGVKKVVTPTIGDLWLFVQPEMEAPAATGSKPTGPEFRKMDGAPAVSKPMGQLMSKMDEAPAVSKPMGPLLRRMDEVNITVSTIKNVAQLGGAAVDMQEYGLEKVLTDAGTSMRVIDKDRVKLYEKTNTILLKTEENHALILGELADIKREIKEIAAQKRGGSSGLKSGVKKGDGTDNGSDGENNGGGENGTDAGSSSGGGGWRLMGVLRRVGGFVGGILFGNGKVE